MSRPLHVAYDLRYASDHFTGIGTHAYHLLEALLLDSGSAHYSVLWQESLSAKRWPIDEIRKHPRITWCPIDSGPMAWGTARATGAWLRSHPVDVYFSPFWLMPTDPRTPVVLTLHDVLPLRGLGEMPWWKRVLFRVALERARHAEAILTSSEFSRREISECTKLAQERVHVVSLGIDSDPDATALRPTQVGSEPFALVVGGNRLHKNHAVLAQAWELMGGGAPLTLVWAGAMDGRFPTLGSLAPSAARVVQLGSVGTAELEWLYRNATLVVFPTRYEGFGLPLIEAAARGTPVLCSDIPVLREVGGDFAAFVSPTDARAWSESVQSLAGDSDLREQMREAGMRAAERLSYRTIGKRVLDHLQRVARVAP